MAQKILKVYNFGMTGVNVDSSPIHETEGELRESRNIIRNITGALGGLTNRPGLFHFNGDPANGAILGGISVPFPDEREDPENSTSGRFLYFGFNGIVA
ncbi:MAG: hypothetical protein LC723_13935 [Actinobacteria bacterium]|nr:hypothetical protein [Actinomycetota bacterium]